MQDLLARDGREGRRGMSTSAPPTGRIFIGRTLIVIEHNADPPTHGGDAIVWRRLPGETAAQAIARFQDRTWYEVQA